jgi:uncharacterized protein (TIGR00290 family)
VNLMDVEGKRGAQPVDEQGTRGVSTMDEQGNKEGQAVDLKGKKFVASYSGGKDSMFAVYRAIQAGLVPVELITTYNEKRSWFHGMAESLLQRVSASVGIPLTLIRTPGELYQENFEKALAASKEKGAEVCVFGDIDIEGHLKWCTERCETVGLLPYFPLWKESRKQLVYDFIDAGFKTVITLVDTSRMPEEFLGQVLTRELADAIEQSGADICGENGEYHTFTFDGPLFANRVDYTVRERTMRESYAGISID